MIRFETVKKAIADQAILSRDPDKKGRFCIEITVGGRTRKASRLTMRGRTLRSLSYSWSLTAALKWAEQRRQESMQELRTDPFRFPAYYKPALEVKRLHI